MKRFQKKKSSQFLPDERSACSTSSALKKPSKLSVSHDSSLHYVGWNETKKPSVGVSRSGSQMKIEYRPQKTHSKDLKSCVQNGKYSVRWPVEMEVIATHIHHVDTAPEHLELFSSSHDVVNDIWLDKQELSQVVFEYHPKLADSFTKSSLSDGKFDETACGDQSVMLDSSLNFESRFESGNLEKAVKTTPESYKLFLRTDLYAKRHCQWFYFKITNTKASMPYKFRIANFTKPNSLYNSGMKPLMYSETEASKNNVGWIRAGSNITYSRINDSSGEQDSRYVLSFELEFPHDNDTVYIAHCYPYTYTKLLHYLKYLRNNSFICKQEILCRSVAGNNVHLLTITSPSSYIENSKKEVIFITARVHPGESNSSYVLEGIVNFLTSNLPDAQLLRQKFVFKIIPMLNPDGVIVGNSRCSLSGKDLNRCYRSASRELFPSIWYSKQLIRRFVADHNVVMYCDLHGHSRKHNVFVYGCENKKLPQFYDEQLFPLMFQHSSPDHFSFENCHFKVQKCKEGTSRVVMWQLGVSKSYTIEASLSGSTLGQKSGSHFNTEDYRNIGKSFCNTLVEYISADRNKVRYRAKLLQDIRKKMINENACISNGESSSEPESEYTRVSSGVKSHKHLAKIPHQKMPKAKSYKKSTNKAKSSA